MDIVKLNRSPAAFGGLFPESLKIPRTPYEPMLKPPPGPLLAPP